HRLTRASFLRHRPLDETVRAPRGPTATEPEQSRFGRLLGMASEQASRAPDRRRSRVVDRAFQLKYTLMAVAFTVVVSLTYMTMVYLEHFAIEKEIGMYCSATAAAELLQKSASMVGYILVGTLLISLLLTALGVVATHRIAGPIFVMNRYLGVLSAGRI